MAEVMEWISAYAQFGSSPAWVMQVVEQQQPARYWNDNSAAEAELSCLKEPGPLLLSGLSCCSLQIPFCMRPCKLSLAIFLYA